MYKLMNFVNIVLLLGCTISPALSHNCYQCTTVKSGACEDPLYSRGDINSTYCMPGRELAPVFEVLPDFFSAIINGVFAIVASFTAPSHVDMSCVKLEIKQGEERNAILRFCASKDTGMQLCNRLRNSAANSTAHCSICYTDGCNLASSTLPSSVLAVTLTLASCVTW